MRRRNDVHDFAGAWTDLPVGVNPVSGHSDDAAVPSIEWADASLDMPGIPEDEPINTRFEGPWGLPAWDAKEDPGAKTDLFASADPVSNPRFQDAGAVPIVGAYEGAVRTDGPVYPAYNGYEASGGLEGDQAYGRIMRFPANIPSRYDPEGVHNIDYADELASAIHWGTRDQITETEYVTDLLMGI